ncbi:putative HhH-GPD family protein [Herbihabitans rhizosphaerae]|uniref:Putative HhH-GPD family protein n=1 Tax=Herbihabitans rhizosphaerae TaxID=1872711 RepID=A0A4Q7L548_9PSEU|nr:hypothetical protein [Herbihabitans rhizosphaerae]RZS44417.1 putative HhH-GPD family protein [Herbihabitans rhizosphaerae]
MPDWMPDGKLPDATTKQGAFLFLIGTILNQTISGELAWRGVARLATRLDLHPYVLQQRSVEDIEAALRRAPAIHPFAGAMARAIKAAADQVCQEYHGDARSLWRTAGSTTDLTARMTSFRQVGRHKAEVAVFLLAVVYGEWETAAPSHAEQICPALLTYLGV